MSLSHILSTLEIVRDKYPHLGTQIHISHSLTPSNLIRLSFSLISVMFPFAESFRMLIYFGSRKLYTLRFINFDLDLMQTKMIQLKILGIKLKNVGFLICQLIHLDHLQLYD